MKTCRVCKAKVKPPFAKYCSVKCRGVYNGTHHRYRDEAHATTLLQQYLCGRAI